MLALVRQLEVVREQIAAYDKEINRLFQQHSDSRIFASLPGAAGRLAPRLLAEWGADRERYENAAVVQALAGTSPVLFQSGKYRFARQRKSCVKPFRRAMHLFAFQSIRQVSWAREYYDTKRSQGQNPS
ncbi:transposase IS111A/IS1328/IS1533 [Calderihabitans maritimus]|uniref:Transposase IS111A/IS1328/IS1533 n=1 Tax=Calderihabitans maritimus TaxID=1246530 RepID=A0A1Z5HWM7_9FIRM|nr:transposase IS111A/IS1328/IS1533 [Calderihabitans maritimus]